MWWPIRVTRWRYWRTRRALLAWWYRTQARRSRRRLYRHNPILVHGYAGRADIRGIGTIAHLEDGTSLIANWLMTEGSAPGIEVNMATGAVRIGGWSTGQLQEIVDHRHGDQ